eukprot:GHRR01036211.1.p1 GENE.GHRR01036211.1~~GHRR01036211.1.p1  ORF type:complete len:106 (+),score=2.67 GHRR01036211.1:206-523(+)
MCFSSGCMFDHRIKVCMITKTIAHLKLQIVSKQDQSTAAAFDSFTSDAKLKKYCKKGCGFTHTSHQCRYYNPKTTSTFVTMSLIYHIQLSYNISRYMRMQASIGR